MIVIIIRLVFITVMGILGYQLTSTLFVDHPFKSEFLIKTAPYLKYIGTALGIFLASIIIIIERGLKRISVKNLIIMILGFISGLALANLAAYSLLFFIQNPVLAGFVRMFLIITFGYFGAIVAIKKHSDFAILGSNIILGSKDHIFSYKVLDTNVIIDGRIADIVESGFLEGILVIPRFVLHELHLIADSSDDLRRNRGRRGLEILNRIQKKQNLRVEINEKDFPEIKQVDEKLVALAKSINGYVVTNDYNLNKIAELQGVRVLNIHDLATAVKPVILPGETMQLRIIKEGKEYGQGIGYLEDGTMIVVENARKHLGIKIEIIVTSVLQTTAGRMIFGQFKQELKND